MSFSKENGYLPVNIDTIMNDIRLQVNTQFGTSYTVESFVGTNFYKFYYALAQRLQLNEVKTSEIFLKAQDYFKITNERIQRPVATAPGIIEALSGAGYIASLKKPILAEAGQVFICVQVDGYVFSSLTLGNLIFRSIEPGVEGNAITIELLDTGTAGSEVVTVVGTDISVSMEAGVSTATQIKTALDGSAAASALISTTIEAGEGSTVQAAQAEDALEGGTGTGYPAKKLAIATLIKNSVAAGLVTQGDQVETIVLTNAQDFDFKYSLPNRIDTTLRLTIHLSDNNQVLIKNPEEVKNILIQNIADKYRLGRDFEPQKYFTIEDAPWAATVLLEWSHNGGDTYSSAVYEAAFDDLFEIGLEDIILVET